MIIRFMYSKTALMKYLGHLDLMRFFERSFRRLALPLAFTEGYNPHPKMNFGGPLSVGVASLCELMEVEVTGAFDIDDFIARFNDTAPEGIKILAYRIVDNSPSLMHALALMTYRIVLPDAVQADTLRLDIVFQNAKQIILRKRNKKRRWVDKDLKPFVAEVRQLAEDQSGRSYLMSTYSRADGSAKPKDVIRLLFAERADFQVDDVSIVRTGMFYCADGVYHPLMEL